LLPDLLSKEEPETGDWHDILPFQYHYNVLPGSIISRFIVRMNRLISKNTYWRNGVVLTKGSNKALVKADKEDRKIFICVSGNSSTRRILLESIRDQFDYIHSTIPGIEIEEKVPLPDRPDVLVDYKNLLDMEAMNVQEFVPSGVRKQVRVRDLLAGIETYENREQRLETRRELTQRFPPPTPQPDPKPEPLKRSQNPWKSGLFSLFVLFAVTAFLAILSHYVPWQILPVVIIGGLLAFSAVIISQLRQDDKIDDNLFYVIMSDILERLPLLKGNNSPNLPDKTNQRKD
jgi:internalin A